MFRKDKERGTIFLGQFIDANSSIKPTINNIVAKFEFDGDWGIKLIGDIPKTWKVKTISANAPPAFRRRDNAGQFIHIQVPDDKKIVFIDLDDDDE